MTDIIKTILLLGAGYWAFNKIMPLLGKQPTFIINNTTDTTDPNDGKNEPLHPADVDKTDNTGGSSPFFGIKNAVSY